MTKITKESLANQLKEKGLRITPQRLAIIEVLIENKDLHPGGASCLRGGKEEKEEFEFIDGLRDAQRVFPPRNYQNASV